MSGEIASTHDVAEAEWDGQSEPQDVRSDIVATVEAENKGIEFHVSMRDYTQRDMEELIVEAAARTIVGRHNDRELARKIEAKCIELIDAKATNTLEKITAEIIDQPLTPQWISDKKPVTMREFLGLYGREYLTQIVDHEGKPTAGGWGSSNAAPRMDRIVAKLMDAKFKSEIEKATNAAIREVQTELAARHNAILEAEKTRFRDALAKTTGGAA